MRSKKPGSHAPGPSRYVYPGQVNSVGLNSRAKITQAMDETRQKIREAKTDEEEHDAALTLETSSLNQKGPIRGPGIERVRYANAVTVGTGGVTRLCIPITTLCHNYTEMSSYLIWRTEVYATIYCELSTLARGPGISSAIRRTLSG
jgi:hypothetical protein